jgi:hypothetical protein
MKEANITYIPPYNDDKYSFQSYNQSEVSPANSISNVNDAEPDEISTTSGCATNSSVDEYERRLTDSCGGSMNSEGDGFSKQETVRLASRMSGIRIELANEVKCRDKSKKNKNNRSKESSHEQATDETLLRYSSGSEEFRLNEEDTCRVETGKASSLVPNRHHSNGRVQVQK